MASPDLTRESLTARPAVATPGTAAHDAGLLVLRLALGLTLAAHGCQKLFGWFGGGGIHGTGQFFSAAGYPAGEAMAVVAAVIETFGGLAVALGLLTPLAAGALAGNLGNALAVHGWGGFFAPKGGEYELFLLLAAAAVTLAGPGRVALDRYVPVLRTHRLRYGAGMLLLAAIVSVVFVLVRD